MFSLFKKFIVFISIFSLFAPLLPAVFAADNSDFCSQVQSATCDSDLNSLSGDSRLKNCSQSVQSGLLSLVNKCKTELEKEQNQKKQELKTIENKQNTAEKTLNNLTLNIKQLNTEIASLNLTLAQLDSAIKEREKAIKELNDALFHQKEVLAATVRQLYEYDTTSYVEVFLGYGTLSDFNQKLEEMESLQTGLQKSIDEISKAKQQMEQEKAELAKKQAEQEKYKELQEFSRQSLAVRQQQQQYLIQSLAAAKTPLEKEMARIETELISLRSAMSRIQSYLASWLLGGTPSWSQIFSAVNFASQRTGVNIFTMLGILQIESSFQPTAGKNMGSPEANLQRCLDNRVDDTLCYQQKPVFEEICAELGLDPNKVPISYAYAMGPAQFIPTTWRGYQKKDSSIKNPWRLEDAVLAMAYKLAAGGVEGYNPGHPTYVDKVTSSATVWEEIYNSCGGFNLDCPNLQNRLQKMGIPTQ